MADVPQRIWANVVITGDFKPLAGEWNHCDVGNPEDAPYILATPEALAAQPEVQALIRAAKAEGMRDGLINAEKIAAGIAGDAKTWNADRRRGAGEVQAAIRAASAERG